MTRPGEQKDCRLAALTWAARLVAAAVVAVLLTGVGVTFHALWLVHRSGEPAPASVIVVLGGGVRRDGTPGPDTLARTNHAIALYRAGLAPRMHFTGGHTNPRLPGLGTAMADVAIAAGVPPSAITVEDTSRSTLQNALLSRPMLPPATTGPIIVVSDGYHLARAWAIFRWVGYRHVAVSAATSFGDGTARTKLRRIARESLAWSYNFGRIAVWEILKGLGVDEPETSRLLASASRKAVIPV
ncbi:MAG: YdcF family protein [Rhodobacteraceae bacterium]|nr:YdcF family protein [Paracoccaceae bacterium]